MDAQGIDVQAVSLHVGQYHHWAERDLAAHGGGYLPSYIGRSDHCASKTPQFCKPVEKLPSEYLKQLYFDSLVYTPENLRHVIETVGAEQEAILGGTAARLLGIRQVTHDG